MTPQLRLQRLLEVVRPLRDVLEQRVDEAKVPAWCSARGWEGFLLGLDESELQRCEAQGLGSQLPELVAAPADLRTLGRDIESLVMLPRLDGVQSLSQAALRSVKQRKRAQLSGLLSGVAAMASAAGRIVDVGAGSGHFTRLSAELFARPALGLEHNPERVESARQRSPGGASYVVMDARTGLQLSPHDLAIGLHACGELGDRLVENAADAGCHVALVSCCLQKISTPTRRPLSRLAASVELKREHLGLTNLTAQPQGIEASIEVTIGARQTRYALGQLLRARGLEVEPGAEMAGINRRRATRGLRDVAEKALTLRGLPAPTDAELEHHETAAKRDFAVIRRLSLPRSMLSRLIEVLVCLDRAAHLEERGLTSLVATIFDRAVSPRNIAIFASSAASRLPVTRPA